MLSPSLDPISDDLINTQRALLTMEAFFQASGCSELTKNAWLYLKKAIYELSTTLSIPTSSAKHKILEKLSAIEKKPTAPTALLLKSSTYADSARPALCQIAIEKPVSDRALKKVMIKVIDNTKPSQSSEQLVELIDTACFSTLVKS
jgi:hypothetical protein